jgi:hypothetical protein
MRLTVFTLLACSFLTVQAHVVRERARAPLGNCARLVNAPVERSGQSQSGLPGLGGGTTRALQEASYSRWASTAASAAVPQVLVAAQAVPQIVAQGPQPAAGDAPPILRI